MYNPDFDNELNGHLGMLEHNDKENNDNEEHIHI